MIEAYKDKIEELEKQKDIINLLIKELKEKMGYVERGYKDGKNNK